MVITLLAVVLHRRNILEHQKKKKGVMLEISPLYGESKTEQLNLMAEKRDGLTLESVFVFYASQPNFLAILLMSRMLTLKSSFMSLGGSHLRWPG